MHFGEGGSVTTGVISQLYCDCCILAFVAVHITTLFTAKFRCSYHITEHYERNL